jgi:CheY-like chemotaxis protein
MKKKRILLVDDSKTTLLMEKMVLRSGPYELAEANDGAEAVEKATASPPDLILMDMIMPNVTGLEAVRRLRAQETTRGIPVIMVTTRGEQHNVDEAHSLGCDAYLTKPIDQARLLATVKALLEAGRDQANG